VTDLSKLLKSQAQAAKFLKYLAVFERRNSECLNAAILSKNEPTGSAAQAADLEVFRCERRQGEAAVG
jgi:hypothetical protein